MKKKTKKRLKSLLWASVPAIIIVTAAHVSINSIRAPYTFLDEAGNSLQEIHKLRMDEKSFDYNEYVKEQARLEQQKVNAYSENIAIYSDEAYKSGTSYVDADLELYSRIQNGTDQADLTAQPPQNEPEVKTTEPEVTPEPVVEPQNDAQDEKEPESQTAEPEVTEQEQTEKPLAQTTNDDEIEILPEPLVTDNGTTIQFNQNDDGRIVIVTEEPEQNNDIIVLNEVPETAQEAVAQVAQNIERQAIIDRLTNEKTDKPETEKPGFFTRVGNSIADTYNKSVDGVKGLFTPDEKPEQEVAQTQTPETPTVSQTTEPETEKPGFFKKMINGIDSSLANTGKAINNAYKDSLVEKGVNATEDVLETTGKGIASGVTKTGNLMEKTVDNVKNLLTPDKDAANISQLQEENKTLQEENSRLKKQLKLMQNTQKTNDSTVSIVGKIRATGRQHHG